MDLLQESCRAPLSFLSRGNLAELVPDFTRGIVPSLRVSSPTLPPPAQGLLWVITWRVQPPNLQALQIRVASPRQSSHRSLSPLNSLCASHTPSGWRWLLQRFQGCRPAAWHWPLGALCWQDCGPSDIWRTLPRNPLCLHSRYAGESCSSPSMFCSGFLQLSKYLSYLSEWFHVQLHMIEECPHPIIIHKTRGKNGIRRVWEHSSWSLWENHLIKYCKSI